MKRAFTLIELLVVIAIIAILAAILFPVFAQAKAAAKKTAALSNIKQVSLSNVMYQTDYDGVYAFGCGSDWWAPNSGAWTYSTNPYMKSYALLLDPSDPKAKRNWPSWMVNQTADVLPISFASNGAMKWTPALNSWAVYGVMGLMQSSWIKQAAANESAITKPSETVAFAARYDSNVIYGTGTYFVGVNWWDDGSNSGAAGMQPEGGNTDPQGQPRTGAPYKYNGTTFNLNDHDGGVSNAAYGGFAPFVFCDGHAKVMKPVATNPNSATRPQDNMWDAYR